MQTLSKNGIATGVLLMPVLPFIEDDPADITRLVELAKEHGAGYILASFGSDPARPPTSLLLHAARERISWNASTL